MNKIPADDDSVTTWIEQLKAGDDAAFELIWTRYFSNLVRLAHRKQIQGVAPYADDDDIVQSALASFYVRTKKGQYPDLHDREGLWRLLVTITLNKVRSLHRKEANRRELLQLNFDAKDSSDASSQRMALEFAEEFERLLDMLDDDLLRCIVVARLDGKSHQEIARIIGKSIPTVERKMRIIRAIWQNELKDD